MYLIYFTFDLFLKDNGKLYLVPTPIGNLEDISLRAINVLKSVDIIACEDTRNTGKLIKLLEIPNKRLIAYHNFNEQNSAKGIIDLLKNRNNIALVSDAGYPLVSDPGYNLVNLAKEESIEIIAIPGSSALIPALASSGFETNAFAFLGFPPAKKGRKTFLNNAVNYNITIILYESPHKIIRLLTELSELLEADRKVSISREISKIHEEHIQDNPKNLITYLEKENKVKGEFVVVIERKK